MRAGKVVLADKGGILSLEQLDDLKRAQAETRRIFSISYNGRLLLPVSVKIDELLRAGAIGTVTHMKGLGPHGLFGHGPREPGFWTRAGRGGFVLELTGTEGGIAVRKRKHAGRSCRSRVMDSMIVMVGSWPGAEKRQAWQLEDTSS